MSVLLSIDPAKVSGWALFVHGKLEYFGTVNTPSGRDLEVQRAVNVSFKEKLPLMVVLEDFGPHWKGHIAFKRACESRGRWLEMLDRNHVNHLDIEVNEWRDGIFGKRIHRGKPREQLKELAVLHAKKRTGLRKKFSHDVAEAILIGLFALQYPPVLKGFQTDAWFATG